MTISRSNFVYQNKRQLSFVCEYLLFSTWVQYSVVPRPKNVCLELVK